MALPSLEDLILSHKALFKAYMECPVGSLEELRIDCELSDLDDRINNYSAIKAEFNNPVF